MVSAAAPAVPGIQHPGQGPGCSSSTAPAGCNVWRQRCFVYSVRRQLPSTSCCSLITPPAATALPRAGAACRCCRHAAARGAIQVAFNTCTMESESKLHALSHVPCCRAWPTVSWIPPGAPPAPSSPPTLRSKCYCSPLHSQNTSASATRRRKRQVAAPLWRARAGQCPQQALDSS